MKDKLKLYAAAYESTLGHPMEKAYQIALCSLLDDKQVSADESAFSMVRYIKERMACPRAQELFALLPSYGEPLCISAFWNEIEAVIGLDLTDPEYLEHRNTRHFNRWINGRSVQITPPKTWHQIIAVRTAIDDVQTSQTPLYYQDPKDRGPEELKRLINQIIRKARSGSEPWTNPEYKLFTQALDGVDVPTSFAKPKPEHVVAFKSQTAFYKEILKDRPGIYGVLQAHAMARAIDRRDKKVELKYRFLGQYDADGWLEGFALVQSLFWFPYYSYGTTDKIDAVLKPHQGRVHLADFLRD
jgi:hypothetical protein